MQNATTNHSPWVKPNTRSATIPHLMHVGAPDSAIDAVIGLGSNLGDRRALFEQALRTLAANTRILGISSLYETVPVGPQQPLFLNAAVRISTREDPEPLLARLLDIERAAGRVRRERWGPRTLDLDLLWIDGRTVDSSVLTVPHPELLGRAFALLPLLDVAPDASDPRTGLRYAELIPGLDRSGVRRLPQGLDL
jgi:2-amino-4-hydroxy-6-hydroxymethyldihydropteridine diphosphokinase